MLGLFGRKPLPPVSATLVLDEAFCHSAGRDDAQVYALPRGTSEVVWRFPDFEAFWQAYVNRNLGLSNETLLALKEGRAAFAAAGVEDGAGQFVCLDGVGEGDRMVLSAATLQPFGAPKPFPGFSSGAILFAIYHLGELRFENLWATLYRSA